jgi:hypothetical protein
VIWPKLDELCVEFGAFRLTRLKKFVNSAETAIGSSPVEAHYEICPSPHSDTEVSSRFRAELPSVPIVF